MSHSSLFPKPPPAEPLSEEIWLKQTDRSEVGREAFFCGRNSEYEVFRQAANSLRSGRIGGGTMIFQGAPGVGKTALMLECMEAIRCHSTPDDPWVAVFCRPVSLMSPVAVVMELIHAANEESRRLSMMAPDGIAQQFKKLAKLGKKLYAEMSERGVGMAGLSVGGKLETENRMDMDFASAWVFGKAAPLLEKYHLVVFVDEAQNTPVADTTRAVMDCLHNPPKNIPLVTAFFGLSDTKQVLSLCGLSRFAANRVMNLQSLSLEDAVVSFRRMVDAYYNGTDEQKVAWTRALAELSQGWPQHINRVGVAAGQIIRTNAGQLDRHLLKQALEDGTEQKNNYYAERLAACTNSPWVYKQLAMTATTKEGELAGILSDEEIDQLSNPARSRRQQTIDEFLTNALHAGVLAPVENLPFHYQFPVPSLCDYLQALPVKMPQTARV